MSRSSSLSSYVDPFHALQVYEKGLLLRSELQERLRFVVVMFFSLKSITKERASERRRSSLNILRVSASLFRTVRFLNFAPRQPQISQPRACNTVPFNDAEVQRKALTRLSERARLCNSCLRKSQLALRYWPRIQSMYCSAVGSVL